MAPMPVTVYRVIDVGGVIVERRDPRGLSPDALLKRYEPTPRIESDVRVSRSAGRSDRIVPW